jgi:hypothetical protein
MDSETTSALHESNGEFETAGRRSRRAPIPIAPYGALCYRRGWPVKGKSSTACCASMESHNSGAAIFTAIAPRRANDGCFSPCGYWKMKFATGALRNSFGTSFIIGEISSKTAPMLTPSLALRHRLLPFLRSPASSKSMRRHAAITSKEPAQQKIPRSLMFGTNRLSEPWIPLSIRFSATPARSPRKEHPGCQPKAEIRTVRLNPSLNRRSAECYLKHSSS